METMYPQKINNTFTALGKAVGDGGYNVSDRALGNQFIPPSPLWFPLILSCPIYAWVFIFFL